MLPPKPIQAVCDKSFTAKRTSGTRAISEIRWIVLHDEEADTAISAARFFTTPAAQGSAHLCVDERTCYRTLPNESIPWGAASAFGANEHGFHIEQAGFARWSSVLWKSHYRTLQRAAYKTAVHFLIFPNVELRFVTAGDLPRLSGITTHAEISKASRRLDPHNAERYSHSDPGPFWPRRLFMSMVRGYVKAL